jgi:hypothetical protein
MSCIDTYEKMESALLSIPMHVLLREVEMFCQKEVQKGRIVQPPDRLDRRSRKSLVCWYCVNHPEVLCGEFTINVAEWTKHLRAQRAFSAKNVHVLSDLPVDEGNAEDDDNLIFSELD